MACKLVFVFAFFLSFSLKGTANTLNNDYHIPNKCDALEFDSLLNVIDQKIDGDWEPPGKLLSIVEFNLIYNNPLKYIECIKKSFANENLSETKKMICLYGVQKLDLDHYLVLTNFCLKLVNNGALNERIFFLMIFPYEWKTDVRFAESYKLENVRTFLKKVIKSEKLPWRKNIKNVLNGRMLKDRKKMAEEGGLP